MSWAGTQRLCFSKGQGDESNISRSDTAAAQSGSGRRMKEEYPTWHAPRLILLRIPGLLLFWLGWCLEGLKKGSSLHPWNPTSTKALGQLLKLLPKQSLMDLMWCFPGTTPSNGVCQKAPGS